MGDTMRPSRGPAVYGRAAKAITISFAAIALVMILGDFESAEVSRLQEQASLKGASARSGDCASIAAEIETSRLHTKQASKEHLSHIAKVKRLRSTAQTAGLTATSLVTAHRDRRTAYHELRQQLQGEVEAASHEVAKYNELRDLAIRYERRCTHHMVSECVPGQDGTP